MYTSEFKDRDPNKKTCQIDDDYDDHEILGLFIMAKVNACIWLAFELVFVGA